MQNQAANSIHSLKPTPLIMKPSRGLSLTDLVNHDDAPPLNNGDNNVKQEEVQAENLATNPASVLAPGPVIVDTLPPVEAPVSTSDTGNTSHTGAAPQTAVTAESDETDTDDEPGEIVFENTKFRFDDEEQQPQKDKLVKGTSSEKKDKQVNAATKEIQLDSKPVKEQSPKTKDEGDIPVEDADKADNKVETQKKENGIKQEVEPVEQDGKKSVEPAKQSKEDSKKEKDIFQQKTSNASVKNNIKKDLKILSELSSSSLPKRYNVPPIWARKWKPTVKALQAIDSSNLKLDDSILGFIPEDDLTKSVQDWIYATLIAVEPELRQFIEVEMKYGLIIDPSTSNRVNPPVSSQCVFTDLDSTMKPDVDERVFDEFNRYIKNLSELNENMGKFNIIDSHASDLSYRVRTHTERPKFLRMTRDVNTGRIAQFIEKRKISQILLYSPKDSYDTKISISLELPVPENDPPEKYKNHTPTGHRLKKRTSYIHNDSCTRFDITRVENKPIRVNNKNEKEPESDTTYEVELEINTPALLNAFDNIQHDSKEYAAIVRTFLNNGTIVRRKLSSLSYDIYKGSNKL